MEKEKMKEEVQTKAETQVKQDGKKIPNSKRIIIVVAIIVAFVAITTFVIYEFGIKVHPQDKYETIAHQDSTYIQYHFNFDDKLDYTKEYKIKDYKVVFNITSDGIPNFNFEDQEKIENLAREYDIYYLKQTQTAIIVAYNDFTTRMYVANKDGIKNLSDVIKGAFAFKNVGVKDNVLTFDVERWSKENYIVATDERIFSAYYDNYAEYVEDNYPVELSYKYDLSNKEFNYEQFETTTTKTIQELCDSIKDIDKQDDEIKDMIKDDVDIEDINDDQSIIIKENQ